MRDTNDFTTPAAKPPFRNISSLLQRWIRTIAAIEEGNDVIEKTLQE
jgi:hypothetical protein